jgi:hypothetical protein
MSCNTTRRQTLAATPKFDALAIPGGAAPMQARSGVAAISCEPFRSSSSAAVPFCIPVFPGLVAANADLQSPSPGGQIHPILPQLA